MGIYTVGLLLHVTIIISSAIGWYPTADQALFYYNWDSCYVRCIRAECDEAR